MDEVLSGNIAPEPCSVLKVTLGFVSKVDSLYLPWQQDCSTKAFLVRPGLPLRFLGHMMHSVQIRVLPPYVPSEVGWLV